jgi:hypothetical protein
MEEIEIYRNSRKLRRENEIGVGSKSALRSADICIMSGI